MKRSEMVNNLSNVLSDIYWDATSNKEASEMILKEIEANGMLPPDICNTPNGYDSKKNADYFYMNKNLNHWEEE